MTGHSIGSIAAKTLALVVLLAFSPLPAAAQEVQVEPTSPRLVRPPPPDDVTTKQSVIQDYEPSPAIWKLADDDTTIYLFGTIHALPEGFRWRSATLERVITEAAELVVETARGEIEEVGPVLFMLTGVRRPDLPQISTLLSVEAGKKWLRLGEVMRMPAGMIDRMNPMTILLADSQLRGAALPGSTVEEGVEAVLEPVFLQSGRSVISIEKPLPLFEALASIDDEIFIPELEQKLLRWDGESIKSFALPTPEDAEGARIDWQEVQHRWARGEPILAEDQSLEGDSAFERAIYERMFADRNAAWTEWLIARLEQPGVVLVAVGALHLYGQDSVSQLLSERGYQLPRVE